jgi:hypothetical protein
MPATFKVREAIMKPIPENTLSSMIASDSAINAK